MNKHKGHHGGRYDDPHGVSAKSFKAGDRVRYVVSSRYGETHDYGTFATHSKEDPDGAYVQFDDPKKGAETYVRKSDLKPHAEEIKGKE